MLIHGVMERRVLCRGSAPESFNTIYVKAINRRRRTGLIVRWSTFSRLIKSSAVVCRTSTYEKRPLPLIAPFVSPGHTLSGCRTSSVVLATLAGCPRRRSPHSPPSAASRRWSPPALVSDSTHATTVACNCSPDSDGCNSGGDGPVARRQRSPSARSPSSKSQTKKRSKSVV